MYGRESDWKRHSFSAVVLFNVQLASSAARASGAVPQCMGNRLSLRLSINQDSGKTEKLVSIVPAGEVMHLIK